MHDPEKTEPSLPGSQVTCHPSASPQAFTEDAEGSKDSIGPAAHPLWLGTGDRRGHKGDREAQDPLQSTTPPPGPQMRVGGWDPGFGDRVLVRCLWGLGDLLTSKVPYSPLHKGLAPFLQQRKPRVTGVVPGRMARMWHTGLWPAQSLRRSLCGEQWGHRQGQADGRPRPSGGSWCRSPGTR